MPTSELASVIQTSAPQKYEDDWFCDEKGQSICMKAKLSSCHTFVFQFF
ncbi:unnamed protein product [Larinioides sclopetarius]|uniref:Uncharacterized protein n=1 Tax=Larinioides sclopetarius TaxID=280406 RepID=A0AAV1ZAQ1_9ARAC